MTTVANWLPSRFRAKGLFLGSLLAGYDAQESLNLFSSNYRVLTFQFLILLSAANCLMARGSPTVGKPRFESCQDNSQSVG